MYSQFSIEAVTFCASAASIGGRIESKEQTEAKKSKTKLQRQAEGTGNDI